MRTPENKKSSVGQMLDILKNQEKKEKKDLKKAKSVSEILNKKIEEQKKY